MRPCHIFKRLNHKCRNHLSPLLRTAGQRNAKSHDTKLLLRVKTGRDIIYCVIFNQGRDVAVVKSVDLSRLGFIGEGGGITVETGCLYLNSGHHISCGRRPK